ncbi:MAG TPA: RsmE family RNA methyltransferase [Polyangiaceae bacterium]|nr:RsmE family RNA methyltransferase [Polyangiaceae bacterium]
MPKLTRVPLSGLEPGERKLDPKTAHYLCDVLRLRAGEKFVAFDPETKLEAEARLAVAEDGAYCGVGALRESTRVSDTGIVLVQALGKGDKTEQVVRSATALGVAELHLVESARSVARVSDRSDNKRARWEAIALDAARQCGRADVPKLSGPHTLARELEAWCEQSAIKLCLVPGAAQSLRSQIADWTVGSPLAILIGPEGGLSGEEVSDAERVGFVAVSFGELVLRTEIAGTAVLGALLLQAQG